MQSIQGEKSRLFIPLHPDKLVQNYRLNVEENLKTVGESLQGFRVRIDTNYTRHIKTYDDFIHRAKRLLRSTQDSVLIMIWPLEVRRLINSIMDSDKEGIRIAIVHYGATNLKAGQVYRHPVEDSIYSARDISGFNPVADSLVSFSLSLFFPIISCEFLGSWL